MRQHYAGNDKARPSTHFHPLIQREALGNNDRKFGDNPITR
jgi:hypothetical protein